MGTHNNSPQTEPGTLPSIFQREDASIERPPWPWIFRNRIMPLCLEFNLVCEFGDDSDESCAIFYDDIIDPVYSTGAATDADDSNAQ